MRVGTAIALLLVGLVLSALFSGVETALTALPFSRAAALAKGGGRAARWGWGRWRARPHRVLVALLAGNTLVNIGISAIATELALGVFGNRGLSIAIGVTTLVVLTFGEVTPKTLARVDPEAVARKVIVPAAALEWLLTPLIVPLLGFSHLVARVRRVSLQSTPTHSRPEDVRFLLSLARQEGHLSELEHGMLEAVLRFEGSHVRQVQKPRTDVVFLPDTLSLEQVQARVLSHGYSRYPVFHGRDDNVIGVLHVKDLLRPEVRTTPWTGVLRPALFVPESKRVVELLREMHETRSHIALSVDEYGNIAGLVTLEDLLEMIVGDIRDEFDTSQPPWKAEGPGTWLVRGSFPLERLSRLIGKPLETALDYTSVAGLLLELAGEVPVVGSRFSVGDLLFEVVEATPRRIVRVRVSVSAPEA